MNRLFVRLLRDQSGATAIEYGLIAALIAVVIIAGAQALGTAINGQLQSLGNTVTTPGGA